MVEETEDSERVSWWIEAELRGNILAASRRPFLVSVPGYRSLSGEIVAAMLILAQTRIHRAQSVLALISAHSPAVLTGAS